MRGLLAGLVDDAGLFPPELLSMGDALVRHHADELAAAPMLSHRFLCPAGRLGELRGAPELRRWTDVPLRLGLILDTGLDSLPALIAEVAGEPAVALEMVEVPAPSVEAVDAVLAAVPDLDTAVYVEGPRDPGWVKDVGAAGGPPGLGGTALRGAKVRCGGVRADLFPSPEELGAFVCACAETGVPFKATAGLHGAVRHRDDQTGFVHHGFLNLLLAAVRASSGAPVDEVAAVLSSTDGAALAAEARGLSARSVAASRLLFRAYGSCSTSEPQEEAAALGLLPGAEA